MNYSKVVISHSARRSMIDESTKHKGVESGGVLVGHVVTNKDGTRVLMVGNASDGGPMAIRRADMFARDTAHCQRYLNRAVALTDGRFDYVGEWHKHPTLSTRMSPLDEQTIRQIAGSFDYGTDQPLFLIVAMPDEKVWRNTQIAAFTCFDGEIHEIADLVVE